MIFDEATGKRMLADQELAPFVAAWKNDMNGTPISIRAKSDVLVEKVKYLGTKVVNNQTDAEGSRIKVAPPAGKVSCRGAYINKEGHRVGVIYSKTYPRMQNGSPVFTTQNLDLGETNIDPTDVDLSVFWYCFSKDLDSGFNKVLSPTCKYEIFRPVVAARKRMAEITSQQFETEIAFPSTRMSYDSVKAIMEILKTSISGDEDVDRLRLLDMVKGDKSVQDRYNTAKISVLKNVVKYDLSDTSKTVEAGKKAGVLYQESGLWMLKKTDTISEKITEIKGSRKTEQDFSLAEFLSFDPALVEQINALLLS